MKNQYLLHYNETEIHNSIIEINQYIDYKLVKVCNDDDGNYSGNGKLYREAWLFDSLADLKIHLRRARDEEYLWNWRQLHTPKTEVTWWINQLSNKTIYEQEINRLTNELDYSKLDNDKAEYEYNFLKTKISNFGEISGIISESYISHYDYCKNLNKTEDEIKQYTELRDDYKNKVNNLLKGK